MLPIILIVDDNAFMRKIVRDLLSNIGIRSTTEAVDGITALGEIRKINPVIPAIAFTAAVYDNMREDLLSKGFTEFVPKPFRPEDLHNKIGMCLSGKASVI